MTIDDSEEQSMSVNSFPHNVKLINFLNLHMNKEHILQQNVSNGNEIISDKMTALYMRKTINRLNSELILDLIS